MKCEDLETHMADALGDELSPEHRQAFDAHLRECEKCRTEYEGSHRAIDALRVLSGPKRVSVRREGGRLIIQTPESSDASSDTQLRGVRHLGRMGAGLLRYAATILIAFTAGYGAHAGLMMADDARPPQSVTTVKDSAPRNLRGSLASAHARNPSRSGLAKCLAAITPSTP